MFEEINELKKAKNEYDALMKSKGENAVRSAIRAFFDAYPEVKALRWHQYTPYFNDGDACYFGYYGAEVKLGDTPIYYECPEHEGVVTTEPAKCGKPKCGRQTEAVESEDEEFVDSYDDSVSPSLKKALENFDSAMEDALDALEIAFGDHSEVTATRDEIKVDEYEHD